jgi:uncharacterized membrane protein YdbT with pleckstrin-like domain
LRFSIAAFLSSGSVSGCGIFTCGGFSLQEYNKNVREKREKKRKRKKEKRKKERKRKREREKEGEKEKEKEKEKERKKEKKRRCRKQRNVDLFAFSTSNLQYSLNFVRLSRHCTEASTLAGELIFGSLSIEMTESIIVDTV